MIFIELAPLPDTGGGGDITLVILGEDGKPQCVDHGAMNKVSAHGHWRCISTSYTNNDGSSGKRCNAGAMEVARGVA